MSRNAHRNECGSIQSIAEHNQNVAMLCSDFSVEELKELCYLIGQMHDIGKYCNSFQKRIRGENIRVDHSTAGAVEISDTEYGPFVSFIAQLCIAGHHTGIPNAGLKSDANRDDISSSLYSRIARKKKRCAADKDENYDEYKTEIIPSAVNVNSINDYIVKDCKTEDDLINKFSFIVRYCFSCLVDADSIDTGLFYGTKTSERLNADFRKCLEKVDNHLNSFICKTKLQEARNRLQKQAFDKIDKTAKVYLMNMPTGSGKTLCSIKFALEKAIRENKKRIIYVIPYNNIIDQTVSAFEKIFGKDMEILRHQSSFSYEDQPITDEQKNAIKNGTENWDAPVIVTTAVQFFESLHSNKRNRLQKIHNISDAIIIFDEAHLMPVEYLEPCLKSISYVTKYLNCESLFLTATMPNFEEILCEYTSIDSSEIVNLIDDTLDFKLFRKCNYVDLKDITMTELLAHIENNSSSLVITNKKNTARELYENADGEKYYLSTYLTGKDRQEIIAIIRKRLVALENDYPDLKGVPQERRIKVFSTSLVEAGVDFDFQNVYREIAGLDSILQSGGRCNREGKRKNAATYIFEFSDNANKSIKTDKSSLTKGILHRYKDIQDTKCIEEYYDRLYRINRQKIEGETMSAYCKRENLTIANLPFADYSENFHLINSKTESVIVPQDAKSRTIIEKIKNQEYIHSRDLQKYACTISKRELEELKEHHAVDDYGRGIWCITNTDYYSKETGIRTE